MDKTFCCEASRLAWGLYKNDPRSFGMLELYLNLENDLIKVDEIVDCYSLDQGPELEL